MEGSREKLGLLTGSFLRLFVETSRDNLAECGILSLVLIVASLSDLGLYRRKRINNFSRRVWAYGGFLDRGVKVT